VELPLENKSSFIPRINFTMAIVFGPNKMTKSRTTLTFLMVLTAIALYFCYLLVAPFLKPIIFSSILAIIFYPLQARIHRSIRNRHISALLSTIVVILLITLLSIFLGRAIVSGLGEIYQSLRGSGEGRERLSLFIVQFIDRAIAWTSGYVPISAPDLQKALLTQVEKVVAGLVAVTAGAFQSITSLAVNALMTFFILFFLLRDGRSMLRRGAVILPLKPNQVTRLYRCVKDTLNAIVYGTLAIAAVQGTLTGLAFWVLGVSSPVIWGVVTTLCALLPIVGTTFVLLPAMFMLILSGHWVKGLILLIWGIFVVHPVDNVLRPYLIGEHTKLSTLYVFFAVLGGLKTFGGLGVFIGPLVLAVTVALFRFLREEKRAGTWSLEEDGG
jgi:predicted PurR-regulated permease PerM